MDDFELDAETLRQIEEDARRKVEDEFELDEETMKEIEAAALREAGLLEVDFGEQTLSGISAETLKEMSAKKTIAVAPTKPVPPPTVISLTPTMPPAAPIPPPAPTAGPVVTVTPEAATAPAKLAALPPVDAPATPEIPTAKLVEAPASDAPVEGEKVVQEARKKAYDKARREALDKAKTTAADKARMVASRRKHSGMASASPSLAAVEAQPKGGKMMFLVIGACVVVMLIIVAIVGSMGQNSATTGAGKDDPAAIAAPAEVKPSDEFSKLREELTRLDKGTFNGADNLKKAIADIDAFRERFPDYSTSKNVDSYLTKRREKYASMLETLFGPNSEKVPTDPEPAATP